MAATFNASVSHTSDTATVIIKNFYSGGVYTEYTLNTDLYGALDAFCVEAAYASSDKSLYELLALPAEDKFYHAAWLAEQYWKDTTQDKELYQIAIWETVFDSGLADGLGNGNFSVSAGVDLEKVQAILGMAPRMPSSNVFLAHNPVAGTTTNQNLQDYLVRPVQEPATMLLLGAGLIGLAGFGRKKFLRST